MKKKDKNDTIDVYVTMIETNTSLPTLKFDPDPVPIENGKTVTIYWKRRGSNFNFVALAIDHANPFSNIIVKDDTISAVDCNQRKEDHHYAVLVETNGTYYSSRHGAIANGGPTIRNK